MPASRSPRALVVAAVLLAFIALSAPSTGAYVAPSPMVQTPAAQSTSALSNADVIKMVKAGLSEQVVLASIDSATSKQFDVSPNGLIALKTGGVSDAIIGAMQRATSGPAKAVPSAGPAVEAPVSATPPPAPKQVTVAAGTELKVQLAKAISSDQSKVGDLLEFAAVSDFLADGETVIKRGTVAWGKITKATSQRFTRAGSLEFTIDSIKGVDGTEIPLRSTQSVSGGRGAITGNDVKVAPGTVFAATIDHDVVLTLVPAVSPSGAKPSGVTTNGASAQPPTAPSPAAATASGDPDDPLAPHDSGIYVQVPDAAPGARLVPLEPTVFAQTKTGNMLATAMTYGIKKAKFKAVARGRTASLRIRDVHPVFYFYFERKGSGDAFSGWMAGASSPNEFILAKMDQTDKERELIVGEFGAFGGSMGTRSEDTLDLKIERLRTGVYKVTVGAALEFGGEYCLFYAAGSQALGAGAAGKLFDFGIDVR